MRARSKVRLAVVAATWAVVMALVVLTGRASALTGNWAVFVDLSGNCGLVDQNGAVVPFSCVPGAEAVRVTSDGTRAVIGSFSDNTLSLFDLTALPAPIPIGAPIAAGVDGPEELAIAAGDAFGIVTGSADGKVSKFTLSPFAVIGTGGPFVVGDRGGSPQGVGIALAGDEAVLPMFDNTSLQIIGVTGPNPTSVATIPTDRTHHGIALSEKDNDTILATGTLSGITVASRGTRSVTTVLSTGEGTPQSVRIKCDGSRAVVETSAGLMWIDMTTSPPTVLSSNFGPTRMDGFSTSSLAFSRDGSVLFVGGGNQIDIYNANANPPTLVVSAFETASNNVATQPCGRPVARNDSYETSEDTPLNIAAPGVLANDTDATAATLVSGPSHAAVEGFSLNANGSFNYAPVANFNGADTFTYKATNANGTSNVATVTITVLAVNDAPAAAGQSVTTAEDTPLLITLSASDVDSTALTFIIQSGPTNGTLSSISGTTCTTVTNGTGTPGATCTANVTYAPATNYSGGDLFTFRVNDGTANSTEATVTITVTPVNDAPVLTVPAPLTVNEGSPISFSVAATDVDGPSLTFSVSNLPSGATLAPDGTTALFTWTPSSAQGGPNPYTIQITVSDGQLSDMKVVQITVNDTQTDTDGDGVPDASDNCPNDPNTNQTNVCQTSPQPTSATNTSTQDQDKLPVTVIVKVTNDKTSDVSFLPPSEFTMSCRVIDLATNQVVPIDQIPEAGPFVMNLADGRPGDLTKLAPKTTTTFNTTFDLRLYYRTLPNGKYTVACTYVQWSSQILNPTADDPPPWTGEIRAAPVALVVGQYQFFGFFAPLPGAKISQTSTLPVKFGLKDSTGESVTNCTCLLTWQQLDGNGNPIGPVNPATPTSGTGNQFKYDARNDQYVFNIAGRSLPLGPVQLQADLRDGSAPRTVNIIVVK